MSLGPGKGTQRLGNKRLTTPLDYQSLMPDQVTELQKPLHEFPQLMSDMGHTDVLEHDVNVGDAPPI